MQQRSDRKGTSGELNKSQIEAVSAWLESQGEAISCPLSSSLIVGGRSNYSHLLADRSERVWVLRHPPTITLDSAHDMDREFRVLDALQGSDVPVPRLVGTQGDTNMIGVPFNVMEYVPGSVLRDLDAANRAMSHDERRQTGDAFVSTLASLHHVDYSSLGLSDFQRPDTFVRRQLRRWSQQLQRSSLREIPDFVATHSILSDEAPEASDQAIIHGDYRLDNLIIGDNGRVLAVIDWELWTIGEPLADLAISAVYWSDPNDEILPLGRVASMAEGFPRRDALVNAYSNAAGRDLAHFDFYLAFAYWRLVGILEGIYTRVTQGLYDFTTIPGSEKLRSKVPEIARYSLHLAKNLR